MLSKKVRPHNPKQNNMMRPIFNSKDDEKQGLKIAINDTWGNTVSVTDYVVNGNEFSGNLKYNIYDHFGLDQPDMEKIFVNKAGFRAWFALQHYDQLNSAYKPFVTDIYINVPFSGRISR